MRASVVPVIALFLNNCRAQPADWSSGNVFITEAGVFEVQTSGRSNRTGLPTVCHRYDIVWKEVVLPAGTKKRK